MLKKILHLLFLFSSLFLLAQQNELKQYSYSELFQMIDDEKDTIFTLKDAFIVYNPKTDERFKQKINSLNKDPNYVHKNDIIINKQLDFINVEFITNLNRNNEFEGVISDIVFTKKVSIENTSSLIVSYSKFQDDFRYSIFNCKKVDFDFLNLNYQTVNYLFLEHSSFKKVELTKTCIDGERKIYSYIIGNTFESENIKDRFFISFRENNYLWITNNKLRYKDVIYINNENNFGDYLLKDNVFTSNYVFIGNKALQGRAEWINNTFSTKVNLVIDGFNDKDIIDWKDFKNHFISDISFKNYTLKTLNKFPLQLRPEEKEIYLKKYIDSAIYYDKSYSTEEISLKGNFYNHYKSKFNFDAANEAYIELKDFETTRLEISYTQNPSFRTYFKWKVNQFLKLFSDYGTEPSKAIIFSLYVILFFAFIYLLFPNSWDTLGNKRLLYRFEFFAKYLRRNDGMHTLYLEEKQKDISTFEDFKNNIENSKLELPSFFVSWSKPLYNASMFSSRITSCFLKMTDVLQGKWKDLTPKQKRLKNFQIGFLLIVGLLYDLFIKVLNALMLSINTFTTLGFGEIPIKGLPRYLAIIQGFIGWFMLTIFSVSLISQLLN